MRSPPKSSSRTKGHGLDVTPNARPSLPAYRLDFPGAVAWEADPDSLELAYASDGAVALLGYPLRDWLAGSEFWQERIHPGDRATVLEVRKQIAGGAGESEIEYRMVRSDGRTVWVLERAALVMEAGVRRMRGMLVDITASKLAELRLLAQYSVTKALAESETLAEAAPAIIRAVCETLDWTLGVLWTADDEAGLLICEEVWRSGNAGAQFEELSREIAFPPGIGVPGRVWESGRPLWVPDVVIDDNFPRAPIAVRDGLHAAFGFPIRIGDQTTGVIEFFSDEIREPDDAILSMFQSIGSQIGQFIERKRIQDELRRSEHQLSDFVENANIGLHWVGPDGTILWANRAELEMLGYEVEEYIGRNIADFHVDKEVIARILDRLGAGETLREYEASMRAKDGSIKQVAINSSVLWENDRFVHTRCFTRDVTHGKDLEQQITRHAEQWQSIYILSDAVARSRHVDEIHEKVIDAIQVSLRVDRASLLLLDADGVMRFKAWRRLSDAHRSAVEGHSVWTADAVDPQPVIVPDVETEPGYEELRPVILGEGIRSLAFVPLVDQGLLLGGFMLYYDAPHEFSPEELRLAQTMANHIAFAINRKQSEDALREAEERYRGIFEGGVFGGFQTTPEGGFITANDALARILGYDSAEELVASVTDIARQIHVDPDQRAEFSRILQEAGVVHNFEAQAYRKDGSIIWISLSARALRDPDGSLQGYEGILEDVTPRRRVEHALAENEFRYRTIFDTAGVSLWEEDFTVVRQMLDDLRASGVEDLSEYFQEHPEFVEKAISAVKILDVNAYSVRLFGAKDKGELMSSLSDIFLPETREVFKEELLVIGQESRFFESETVVKTLAGQRLHVLFTISFPDEPSLLNHVMVSRTDITERKLEEQRQQFLAEASAILSASLDYETTLDNVARLVTNRLGDLCSIDLVENGEVRRVALAHVDPAKEAMFTHMTPAYRPQSADHPVLRAVSTGMPELLNGVEEETLRRASRDAKHLKALKALQATSVMIVPLSVGKRVLGAITIVSGEGGRHYTPADLALAEELSRRAGIAIDNAQLYEAREQARKAAESAADRTAGLQAVTASLSEAVTPSEVGAVVAQAALSALDARSALVVALTDEGAFRILAAEGVNDKFKAAWSDYADEPPASIVAAIRFGQPVFAASRRELLERFPALAALPIAKDRSFTCVPLIVEGRAIGSMVLTFARSYVLPAEERELVLALGRLCAQAVERARLYDAAERARDVAETARRRQAFLAEASAILASSLDYQTTLARVADLCVPELADWCAIDITDEDGSINHVAIVHKDSAKRELGRQLRERYPTNYGGGIVKAVLESGKGFVWPELPDDVLSQAAQDVQHLKMLRQLGLKSALATPLTARGKILGMLTLVMAQSSRRYNEEDLALAQEVARRAAIAIDNARLYSAEQTSRSEAEAAQQRLWFLAEANAVLSSSLDFETTLSRVAALAVPWLADCCVAHLFPAEGVEARAAVSHVDATKEALVHELHSRYPPAPGEPHPLIEMIKNQRPVLMEDVEESALQGIIHDDRHREILQQLGFKSYMAAPLIARGRLFGALTLANSSRSRRYSNQELSLAEELARRAALALDNARLYEDSQRVQDALRVALEAKDEFLGVMSHELRTPITAIYGGARVLRSRGERLDDESKSRLMEDIELESERLFRMVENLLVLSRLELGQEVSTEPVLVQRVVSKLGSAFKQRRPSRPLVVNVPDNLEPVAAEPHYLEQILRNLLSNADKYSPSESPIEIEVCRRDGEADLSILDRGLGIAPEEIELIFDRFYRSERTATQAAGIGLGLTVCKRLAEAQAGRIWARPREGGGLQVGVTLPLCKEA